MSELQKLMEFIQQSLLESPIKVLTREERWAKNAHERDLRIARMKKTDKFNKETGKFDFSWKDKYKEKWDKEAEERAAIRAKLKNRAK